LNKKEEHYQGDAKARTLAPMETPDAVQRELERDAVALFQTADDLYMSRRYRVESGPVVTKVTR
jgi:hypothetical protein